MTTMTIKQAWQQSGDADVYVTLDQGEVFIRTGALTRDGLALTVDDGHGNQNIHLPLIDPDRVVITKIYR